MILKNILKTKRVSVWGLGYLGYTTILKLQSSGFKVVVHNFNMNQMRMLRHRKYPGKQHIASWSSTDYLPGLDFDTITIAKDPKEMFKESSLHFIAIPEDRRITPQQNVTEKLGELFSRYLKGATTIPLVVFESAFIPGHIERHFVEYLKHKGLRCSKDYYLGAWFRTDWNVETFFLQHDKMPITGYSVKSVEGMRELFNYLSIPTIELHTIKEAEIYINVVSTIQAVLNDFVRELSLGYPEVNMKAVAQLLFENIKLDECSLTMGTGGTKMTFAIDNLLEGSEVPVNLTLLKELQSMNISSVLNYAEYIIRRNYKSVTVLGLTSKGNQKDTTLSPSITLAEYLMQNSIKVLVNDPLFSTQEIRRMIKGVGISEFPGGAFATEVVVVATDHNQYKYLSQAIIDGLKKKPKLIIDNHGIWSHLSFGTTTQYHQVGDGTLPIAK